MTLTNNLYPPIMPNIIPGFIHDSICRIYFSLSKYNSAEDIANVQITLTNVKTNISAFNLTKYPMGIKLTSLNYDSTITNDYCYYVDILPTDVINNEFALNQYYKVQLRFTAVGASAISLNTPQAIATWLNQNLMYFSEWSRSSLIRGISQPNLTINGLNESSTTTLTTPPVKITGSLSFQDNLETDYLANYNIKIYLNNELVFDSETIYPSIKNTIDYDLLYNFIKGTQYTIIIDYTTQCLYTATNTYNISISTSPTQNPFGLAIVTTPNNDDGYINLNITMENTSGFANMTIYRASSIDNFNLFEKIGVINNTFNEIVWQDLFIEHGIWYKYYLYSFSNNQSYTPVESDPTLCMFEDMFLIHNSQQLKLQFNPSVSGFKYSTTESQQNTIGGKFPYIKRNGNNYYRTFTINGLISSLVDETEWFDSSTDTHQQQSTLPHISFTSKEKEYGNSSSLYSTYESENNISDKLNPLYEKFFREAVYKFLYKDEAKLFKSPTQGNILIYLSNITFEPMQSLGRILYSFSATATEIDEPTFANYIKYNIISNPIFE